MLSVFLFIVFTETNVDALKWWQQNHKLEL